MRFHAFEPGDARRDFADVARRFARHALPCQRLHELVHRQAARVACSAFGRQHVVGAAGLVAIGHRGFFAEKQRAVAGQVGQPPIEIARVHFQVFAGVAVADRHNLLARVAQHHFAVVAPGTGRRVACCGWQRRDQLRHALHHLLGQWPVGGEQPGRRLVPVFCLADQVAGNDFCIGTVVGNHRHFRWPGKHVDADLAEQRALGLGDELVARPHDHVRRLAGEQASSHRRDRLHTTQRHDHVGACAVEGVEQVGMHRPAAERAAAGDDGFDTCRLGCGHAHVGRCDVGITPSRCVATSDVDRQHPLAGRHARVQADGEVLQGIALRMREGADLFDRKVDVAPHLRRHLGGAAVDLGTRQHDLTVPLVQRLGVGSHCCLAMRPDLGQHRRHHRLGCCSFGLRRLARLLQIGGGHGASCGWLSLLGRIGKVAQLGVGHHALHVGVGDVVASRRRRLQCASAAHEGGDLVEPAVHL